MTSLPFHSTPEPSGISANPSRPMTAPPRGLAAYCILAFTFSWTVWLLGGRLIPLENPLPIVLLGGFGPMLAAITITWINEGPHSVASLFRRYLPTKRIGKIPYDIAILTVLAIAASAAIVFFNDDSALNIPALNSALMLAPANFLLIALAGGGNEELGWRGFALPRLQSVLTPLAANTILGFIWAVWHAPLFILAGTAQAEMSFATYALLCVGITIILGSIFNFSKGSIFVTVLAHAGINVVSGLKATAVGDPAGISEIAAVALVTLLIIIITRRTLGAIRQPAPNY